MCNINRKSSIGSPVIMTYYLFIGLLCICFILLSGCRKKPMESQLDSNSEQIKNLSLKAQEAALQAERYQKQAQSKLDAIKEIASQVMTQQNGASEEATLQSAKAAAEESLGAAQSAGNQAKMAVQCSKEIENLIAGSDNKAENTDASSSINESAYLAAQGSQKRAQTSYDCATKSSKLAQEYLELINRGSKTLSESRKNIESARKAISTIVANSQNRQSIEAAIEKLENMQTGLEESYSNHSPERICQLLDQIETASIALNEQVNSLNVFYGPDKEALLPPNRGGDKGRSGHINEGIFMDNIPSLPTPPKIVRNPGGGFEAPELPVEPVNDSTGIWIQTEGGNDADFLPGNYSINELDFKVNGVLYAKRTFGKNNEIILRWQVGYEFNDKKTKMILGKDPKKQPSSASLSGFSIVEHDISVKAAVIPFPAVIDFKQIDEKRIKIGTKIYRKKEA